MRPEKELLLASRTYAHENRLRSWWCVCSTVFVFGASTTVACLDLPLVVRAAASVVSGLVLVRLFVLYHDCQHGAILRKSRLGDWMMHTYGLLTLNPPNIWKRSHDHHHQHNSKVFGAAIGSYPIMTTTSYAQASARDRLHYNVSRHPLNIACGYVTIFLYGMCLRSLLASPRQHWDSGVSIVLHLSMAGALVALAGWDVLVFAQLLPFSIASALGAYLFYAQHNFPGVQLRDRHQWNYAFAALNSSSYIKMNPVMHWFTGNIGYHHVHHLNSRIPFYRLPEAMQGIAELQSPVTTSLHPRDVYRCLRLKLWDAEHEQMVSLRGN